MGEKEQVTSSEWSEFLKNAQWWRQNRCISTILADVSSQEMLVGLSDIYVLLILENWGFWFHDKILIPKDENQVFLWCSTTLPKSTVWKLSTVEINLTPSRASLTVVPVMVSAGIPCPRDRPLCYSPGRWLQGHPSPDWLPQGKWPVPSTAHLIWVVPSKHSLNKGQGDELTCPGLHEWLPLWLTVVFPTSASLVEEELIRTGIQIRTLRSTPE